VFVWKTDSGNRLRLASWYVDETLASVYPIDLFACQVEHVMGEKRLVWRHPEAFWKVGVAVCFSVALWYSSCLLTEEFPGNFRLNNDHDIFHAPYLYSSSPYRTNYRKYPYVWSGDFAVWHRLGGNICIACPVFHCVIGLLVVRDSSRVDQVHLNSKYVILSYATKIAKPWTFEKTFEDSRNSDVKHVRKH